MKRLIAVNVTSKYIKQCPLCGVHYGVCIDHKSECRAYTTITEPDGTVTKIMAKDLKNGTQA